jgi:predicted dinucleotide-binding enzyme
MRRGFIKIAVCGRGRVGGGLADLWERTGHQLTRLGHEGGDVSHTDVVLLAVPGAAVPGALDKLRGVEGRMLVDATNRVGVEPPPGFASTAEYVKAKTGGPTAKSFNTNFARLYPRLAEARVRPSNLWCGDEECRPTVERLIRDAGYEPVRAGGLDLAAAMEAIIQITLGVAKDMGLFLYHLAPPEQL